MAQRTVNERQQDVLKWIHDGCPDGRWPDGDVSYKTTAVALKGRRLVTISKKKGVWSATATDAGKHFVEHGEYPAGHWAPAEPPSTVQQVRARTTTRKVTGLRPVDQLMADIAASDGVLKVESDPDNYYGNLVASAHRYGKVPEGKLLHVSGMTWGPKTVTLADKPDWMTHPNESFVVHDRLVKPHTAVASLRDNTEQRLRFKATTRNRALRLLDALAKEADRRGYKVEAAPVRKSRGYQYDQLVKWDLTFTVLSHSYELRVTEDSDKSPHTPTQTELKAAARPYGPQPPAFDYTPSGRLAFVLDRYGRVRHERFGDTKTLNLADRLGDLLLELELRAADAEQRRLDREREQAERQAQWEAARAQAVIQFTEQQKAEALKVRAVRWRDHNDLTDYVTALANHVAALPVDEQAAAGDWVTWAQQHLTDTDPFASRFLQSPTVPDPSPEQLKPFMKGNDPYGPRRW